jgi:hypothetical protein
MGKYKNYLNNLAEEMGIDFGEVTQDDIEWDFMKKAQIIWDDSSSDERLKQDSKKFLPKISIAFLNKDVYSIGDVINQENTLTGQKYYYLVTE